MRIEKVPTTPIKRKLVAKVAPKPKKRKVKLNLKTIHTEIVSRARGLERYSDVFHLLFNVTDIEISTGVPTLGVSVKEDKADPKLNRIRMQVNAQFWHRMSDYDRDFVLVHEMQHVISDHLKWLKTDKIDHALNNLAADICVNTRALKKLGFVFTSLSPMLREMLVTVDSLCAQLSDIHLDRFIELAAANRHLLSGEASITVYYDWLKSIQQSTNKGERLVDKLKTMDHHGGDQKGDVMPALGKVIADMSPSAAKHYGKVLGDYMKNSKDCDVDVPALVRGAMRGRRNQKLEITDAFKVRKRWAELIKKWFNLGLPKEVERLSWTEQHRHAHLLDPFKLSLPEYQDVDVPDRSRLNVRVYIDFSGSCLHYAGRFCALALSLPKDKFTVSFYKFDTAVEKLPDNPAEWKLQAGGTDFDCIVRDVEALAVHPQAVFVLTDGIADPVTTLKPDRWYWCIVRSTYLNAYMKRAYPEQWDHQWVEENRMNYVEVVG